VSKVSIEIDGLKFNLRISSNLALMLVEALQEVWVAAPKDSPNGELVDARMGARDVFSRVLDEITFTSRKAA